MDFKNPVFWSLWLIKGAEFEENSALLVSHFQALQSDLIRMETVDWSQKTSDINIAGDVLGHVKGLVERE